MTDEPRLCCSRCATAGSWIIPRPEMRDMVVEIAAHVGWCDVQGCDPLCPECGKPALPAGNDPEIPDGSAPRETRR